MKISECIVVKVMTKINIYMNETCNIELIRHLTMQGRTRNRVKRK